jgi:hypothetical protein
MLRRLAQLGEAADSRHVESIVIDDLAALKRCGFQVEFDIEPIIIRGHA